jgi:predicted TIM-barrel fold metal-dependent hydrolase
MIVDSHVHLITNVTGYYAYKKSAGAYDSQIWDADRIVRLMDEVGYDRCFLLTLSGLYGFNDWRTANDEVATAVRRYPDRLIGFCTNWPNQDPEEAVGELLRCLDLGLRGVKYHPWLQSFPANSAYLYPTLEVTSKHRLPVLFHTGTPPYSQPFQVMEQARRFPETPFIIGHFGKLLFLDAVRSAELYPNVYLETSGAQVADLAFAVDHMPAERILFGTDLPVGGAPAGRWNLAKVNSAPLTEEQRRLILGENAVRLMRGVQV